MQSIICFFIGMILGLILPRILTQTTEPPSIKECAIPYPNRNMNFDERERLLKKILLNKDIPCLFGFLNYNSISGQRFRAMITNNNAEFRTIWPLRNGYVITPKHWLEWFGTPEFSSAFLFIENGIVIDVIISDGNNPRLTEFYGKIGINLQPKR
jgi:hypothetical protein